jgi:hypothetical protein
VTYSYYFSGSSENCRSYVRFNGFPLIEIEPNRSMSRGSNVSMWAMPEVSRLEVSLAKPPTLPNGEVKFAGKIFRLPLGADASAAELIWELTWPPLDLGDVVPFYLVFPIETETPTTLWSRAETLSLEPALIADAFAYARHIHSLFEARDADRLTDELTFRNEEFARLEGISMAESVREQREFLQNMMSSTELPFEAKPFRALPTDVRLLGAQRVLRIRNGDEPLLMTTERQGMELYLSRIDGRWVCSR